MSSKIEQEEARKPSAFAVRAAKNREHNRMVLNKLIFFTFLMVFFPIGTFYGLKYVLLGTDFVQVDMWSGFAAVIVVNIVIGTYVVSAWSEDDEEAEKVPPVGRFSTSQKAKQQ